jgi:hypothetical protein
VSTLDSAAFLEYVLGAEFAMYPSVNNRKPVEDGNGDSYEPAWLRDEAFITPEPNDSPSGSVPPDQDADSAGESVAHGLSYPAEVPHRAEELPAPATVDEETVRVADVSDMHIAEALSGFGAGWEAASARSAVTVESGTSDSYDAKSEEGLVSTVSNTPSVADPDLAETSDPSGNVESHETEERGIGSEAEAYVSWGESKFVEPEPAVFSEEAIDDAPDAWGATVALAEEVFFGKRTGRRRGGG